MSSRICTWGCRKLAASLSLAAGLAIFTGCGGSPTSTSSNSSQEPSQTAGATGDANTTDAQQNAEITIVENGGGTEPAQCVAIFLDSLRSGNENAINDILTDQAKAGIAQTSWQMQPLGTPDGRYEIGRVASYEDKTVALVECTWLEPPATDGTQLSLEIVCEVHQEPAGWRISGIALTEAGQESTLVLDFEDAAGLQATIDAATGRTTPASGSRLQASQSSVPAQTVSGGQAPATQLPNYQQQVPNQQMPNYQQQTPNYQQPPASGSYPNQLRGGATPAAGAGQGGTMNPGAGSPPPNAQQGYPALPSYSGNN
ncbi:MAG: hypothetical protein AB8B50_10930 [Pirellulaceae bacterium]